MNAQDLKTHRWENRILLIHSTNQNSETYQKQLAILQKNESGLKERKLLIYQLKGEEYQTGITFTNKWKKIEHQSIKDIQKNIDADFEVILIGLDGRIKLSQNSILSSNNLFSLIDGMPMRRQEIENEKN